MGDDTIHVLVEGLPLCGFSRAVPRDWPAGHQWVRLTERASATCPGCLGRSAEEVDPATQRQVDQVVEILECIKQVIPPGTPARIAFHAAIGLAGWAGATAGVDDGHAMSLLARSLYLARKNQGGRT